MGWVGRRVGASKNHDLSQTRKGEEEKSPGPMANHVDKPKKMGLAGTFNARDTGGKRMGGLLA